jgi:hypothetical protein
MSPGDRDVLTSLPNARPTRRSAKRASREGTAAEPAAAAKPAAKAAKKAPAAKKATAKAPAAKAKPAAKRAPAAKKAAAKPKPSVAATEATSSPPPPPSGWASPRQDPRAGGSGDLIGTAVQAVGEIAQIGLTYGGQALRQALSRLPKP